MNTEMIFDLQIDMEATGALICSLLDRSGLSREDVMNSLGLTTTQTFWKWRHGKSIPSTDNLIRLSALLGRSIDSLLVIKGWPMAERESQTRSRTDRSADRTGRERGDDRDSLPVFLAA